MLEVEAEALLLVNHVFSVDVSTVHEHVAIKRAAGVLLLPTV